MQSDKCGFAEAERALMRAPTHSHHIIPASCRHPASRHSRCSAQARASGLAGAERAKPHSRSTRTTPRNLAASRGEAAEEQR